MAETLRADPTTLARLAAATLAASTALGDAWDLRRPGLELPAAAFGNSAGAAGASQALGASVAAGDVSLSRLTDVLDGDVDRLYRAAFAYERADREAAAAARHAGPGRVRAI